MATTLGSAMLCKSADVADGLLYVLGGGITRVWNTSFPFPSNLTLAMMIHVPARERDREHPVEVTVRSPAGEEIVRAVGGVKLDPRGDLGVDEVTMTPFVIPMPGMAIETPGEYRVKIVIDQVTAGALVFRADISGTAGGAGAGPIQ